MIVVDFWVLSQVTDTRSYWQWLCRWLETRYLAGDSVLIVLAGQQQLLELERLLWIFRDCSLVPHAQYLDAGWNIEDYPLALIQMPDFKNLMQAQEHRQHFKWLVNCSSLAMPLTAALNAEHLVEIVPAISDVKRQMRTIYRTYQQHGAKPFMHYENDDKNSTITDSIQS